MELRTYLAVLRRRGLLILACVVVALTVTYSQTSRSSYYRATAMIYVGVQRLTNSSGDLQPNNDALASIERSILTFSIMIDSPPTAVSALQRSGVARSVPGVLAATTVFPVPATQLIRVDVIDTDPAVARDLANAMSESFVTDVQTFEPRASTEGQFPALPAYVFQRAQLPVVPQTTGVLPSVLTGGLFGLVAAVALAFLLEYLDITVKNAADAERRLELPVLGVIPRSRTHHAPSG